MMTRRVALSLLVGGLIGCKAQQASAPRTEFLLSAGDSTFWVSSGPDGVKVRSAPLMLGHFGGRFYELYVTDDDLSYPEAALVGQRLYRRDLVSGDSTLIYADTAVAGIAKQYAVTHPDAQPLEPDAELETDPTMQATAELEILDTHGPYLSFEYHLDVATDGDDRHYTSRGVVDMRDSRRSTIRTLFDDSAAVRILAEADTAFTEALDSVLASKKATARRAARTLGDFQLDRNSFAIAELDRAASVLFLAPGVGERVGGFALPLRPIVAGKPAWWQAIVTEMPVTSPDSSSDQWDRRGLKIVARYDSTGDMLTVAVVDSQQREWKSRPLTGPAHRIYWLDDPTFDQKARVSLQRAFDESVLYSEDARRAFREPSGAGTFRFARASRRQHNAAVTFARNSSR
jgi:hypothetical protein